ncbi:MAG: glycosyltransferase family 4 protein [Sulfuricurvum sp.]|uniref:glycosyltransferase family 4 protein n=1 Tax=Sulfuricurvum sp. TaxID=2025608 RepID=UPI0025F13D63|nr:glycosyltransferase family 4 protein [Sulfuricurvum sp.]MBV5321113.1 glycosyltransferase family 4 protein [Sulfuricurvum sp.]
MKIVFILPSIKTGGGNRVILELSNELVTRNINIDIVYPKNSEETNTFNISKKITFIPIGTYKNSKIHKLFNLFHLFNYLNKTYKNELLIFTDPIMSIFIPLTKHNKVYRFIQADDYAIYDDLLVLKHKIFLIIYKILTKLSYHYNVKYLFNSIYTYDKFSEILKTKKIFFNLVHPALNHTIFYNQNTREENKINICIVARKHPWKGFIDFIHALNNIQSTLHIDNIYLISHDNLSEFDITGMQLIKPKNDHEIAYYMNKSHIFVSTSWWEGFGLPPLEAMACGCSVVLTDAGGVNEYAVPNENCLMYKPKDISKLQENIIRLVGDKELRNYLSINAQKMAQDFSWAKSTDQLIKALDYAY